MELTAIDLNNLDQFVAGVPHEIFTEMRRSGPYWQIEPDGTYPNMPAGTGYWNFARYDDVVLINKDNQTFSSHRGSALLPDMPEADLEAQRMMMLNMDPPMHTRYRLLINKGFTPRMVGQLEEHIRVLAGRIIDEALERRDVDFVVDISSELPLQVIAELMGVPQEDRHLVFDWSNRMIGSQDPEFMAEPGAELLASMELYGYAHKLADEKRINPHDDLMSILTSVDINGDKLSELELDMFFMLLAVAGNETTRNLMAHAMLALLEHPAELAALYAEPSLLPTAVEEFLRWGTPVMHFRRTVTRDTDVNGFPVKEGDKVCIWYIAANRDDTVINDPFRFDVRRDPNPHVAFGGGGPHFCLGANLARLEIRVMFEELIRRQPRIEQSGPVQRLRSNFINGIKHLPIALTPA